MATSQVMCLPLWHRLKLYGLLTKPRLSIVVVFSALMGGLIGGGAGWWFWVLLFIGGYGVTGAANAFNQILEHETDKLMVRTASRPIPSGQISVAEAVGAAVVWAVIGLLALMLIRWEVAVLGLLAMLIYVLLYTPLKRVGPVAVLVGAIPGALPPTIGYLANAMVLDEKLWVFFGVQFLWQFPHFWVIAWISQSDYARAGFRLLPFSSEKLNKLALVGASFGLSLSGLGVGWFWDAKAGLWTALWGLAVSGIAMRFYRRPALASARLLLLSLTAFLILFYLGLALWTRE